MGPETLRWPASFFVSSDLLNALVVWTFPDDVFEPYFCPVFEGSPTVPGVVVNDAVAFDFRGKGMGISSKLVPSLRDRSSIGKRYFLKAV